jgi:hypothetical protein
MTDTNQQDVVETPAPDANANAEATAKPESSPGAGETSEKPGGKDAVQRRFDKLTYQLRQAERERDYERELRLTQLQSKAEGKQPEPKSSAPKKLADFDYDEDRYAEYVSDLAAERAAEKLEQRQKSKQTDAQRRERIAKFKDSEVKFKAEIDDYEDVAHYARIDDHVADMVMDMDEGPRIAYYLGKNPDIAAKLNRMSGHAVGIELGRIDARLAHEREQAKSKPVSKAPPPPPKIDATEPAVDRDPSQMSDAEFAKWRRKQIAARNKR